MASMVVSAGELLALGPLTPSFLPSLALQSLVFFLELLDLDLAEGVLEAAEEELAELLGQMMLPLSVSERMRP